MSRANRKRAPRGPQQRNHNVAKAPKLTLTRVKLPRRGRGQPIEADLLGQPKETASGRIYLDVTGLKGHPMSDLINLGQASGFDPSEMMAAGYNALIEHVARATSEPSLADKLITEGLSPDREAARLTAMHIKPLVKRFGMTDEDIISYLKEHQAS
jgi:hypothetical protein